MDSAFRLCELCHLSLRRLLPLRGQVTSAELQIQICISRSILLHGPTAATPWPWPWLRLPQTATTYCHHGLPPSTATTVCRHRLPPPSSPLPPPLPLYHILPHYKPKMITGELNNPTTRSYHTTPHHTTARPHNAPTKRISSTLSKNFNHYQR